MIDGSNHMPFGNNAQQRIRSGSVSAAYAGGLITYAESRGVVVADLMSAAGLAPSDLENRDARIPFAGYVDLMRAAKTLVGDPALPLRFAEFEDLSELSITGLLANASETMAEALVHLNRYGQLVMEVDTGDDERFRSVPEKDSIWVVDTRLNPNDFYELTESTFTRLITGPRRFLPRPHVLAAEVTHSAPEHRRVYEEIWQCPVTFNATRNALRIDHELTTHRVRLQPEYVFGVLTAHADEMLKSIEASRTVRGRLEALLMPRLHTGDVRMADICTKLGVSRQTLYRRLKEEGTSYDKVLDELREALAMDYLTSRKVSVNETAYLLGFADPSAFSRAFKRWTGKSPVDVLKH
ncbi:MAG: AraC family transcriptional regulator [Pseudomonadota bacterium]